MSDEGDELIAVPIVSVELNLCQMIEIQRMIEATFGSWLEAGEFGDERHEFRRNLLASLHQALEPLVTDGIEHLEAVCAADEALALDDEIAVRKWLAEGKKRDEKE